MSALLHGLGALAVVVLWLAIGVGMTFAALTAEREPLAVLVIGILGLFMSAAGVIGLLYLSVLIGEGIEREDLAS